MTKDRDELFTEWTKQVFAIVERDQSQIDELRQTCRDCKQACNKHLSEIDRRVERLSVKVYVIATGLIMALGYILKRIHIEW